MYYNKDSLATETNNPSYAARISGYTLERNLNSKENQKYIPCPIDIVINKPAEDDVNANKALSIYLKQFTVEDDSWKELGVKVNLLNGAQKTDITEDMLSDLQKDLIILGEITLDDIRREIGKDLYGSIVKENMFVGLKTGYSKGRIDTSYTDSDFTIHPLELKENVQNTTTSKQEDVSVDKTEDLFDDNEDEI